MAYHQLDLFSFAAAPDGPKVQVAVIKSIPSPVVSQAVPQPTFTIEPNPTFKGFRVVMAPGLTTRTPKNPCLSCTNADFGKDYCSEFCSHESARKEYLETIGIGLINAADGDGSYGIGA